MSNNIQKEYFVQEGGDEWYARSCHSIQKTKPTFNYLFDCINNLPFAINNFLEVGCSSGEKIKQVQSKFKCSCYGIDPSKEAIAGGRKLVNDKIHLQVGTAESLPFEDNFFDVVCFGFCLYLCDRNLLFRIAQEADRVLREGGAIIIVDFDSRIPLRNSFHHTGEAIWSYKMEYEKMFTWHPQYILSEKRSYSYYDSCFIYDSNERVSISTIIKVAEQNSMVTNPWDNRA